MLVEDDDALRSKDTAARETNTLDNFPKKKTVIL